MSERTRVLHLLGVGALLLAAVPLQAQSTRTLTSSRELRDHSPLKVSVEYGAGDLVVRPATGEYMYQMGVRYDANAFVPVTDFDPDTRELHLGLRSRDRNGSINVKEESRATIALTREAPLSLDLAFGAGEAHIDLGGLRLQRLHLSTGASDTDLRFGAPNPIRAEEVQIKAGAAELEVVGLGNTRAARIDFQGGVGSTTLDFTGAWHRDATASVQMGLGALTLRFPRGLGVRIDRNSFLTSFDTEGMVKRGGSYYSSNWESATHHLTVDVNAALGSVEVEWVQE